MNLLAIIAARGGSKGIPKKNLRLLRGKPLIAWTIQEASLSKYISRTILTSEDCEIIKVAKAHGCDVPFKRDHSLALDETPAIDVVLDAIERCPGFDWVVLLQPTSPLRTFKHIDAAIEKTVAANATSCVSVVKVHENPHWMYELDDQLKLRKVVTHSKYTRRQDLPEVYKLNGAIYLANVARIKSTKRFIDEQTLAYQMGAAESIDIDTELDFQKCEQQLARFENTI